MKNNLFSMILIMTILTSLVLTTGCRTDTTEPAPVMIAPGQTTVPLDAFSLRAPPGDGDSSGCGSSDADIHPCPPTVKDVCYWVHSATSLAVIEIIEQTDFVPANADACAGPYSNGAYIARTRVLGVAAGEELPTELRVAFPGYDWPIRQKGLLLVSLAHVDGEWFGEEAAGVMRSGEQLGPEGSDSDHDVIYELPDNFADLATKAMETMDHFEQQCPQWGARPTEAELIEFYRYRFPFCDRNRGEPAGDDAGLEGDAN